MSDSSYLIGRIIKPHGIRGDLRVEIISDFPERFLQLKEVYATAPGGGTARLYHVKSARFHKQWVLLTFSEINSRDEAEELRGYDLTVPAEARWVKDEEFYYFHELEGLPVYLPGGDRVGEVIGFDRGGQLLLTIRGDPGFRKGGRSEAQKSPPDMAKHSDDRRRRSHPYGEEEGASRVIDGGNTCEIRDTERTLLVPFIARFVEVIRGEKIIIHPVKGLLSLGVGDED